MFQIFETAKSSVQPTMLRLQKRYCSDEIALNVVDEKGEKICSVLWFNKNGEIELNNSFWLPDEGIKVGMDRFPVVIK